MLYVTLAEVRKYLNTSNVTNDDELTDFADAAEARVLKLCGPSAVAGSATRTITPSSSGTVVLPAAPVSAVTSVVDAAGNALPYVPYLEAGLLTVHARGPVTVTYTTGASIPVALIRTAILMVLGRLWETQRGNSPANYQGAEGETFTPGLQGILSEAAALLGVNDAPVIA